VTATANAKATEMAMPKFEVTEVFDSVEDGLICLGELTTIKQSCESKVENAIER
tara:strand:- start:368 stop:529 length:162 start_codon:yes stop_codon:yes gene_type:complete